MIHAYKPIGVPLCGAIASVGVKKKVTEAYYSDLCIRCLREVNILGRRLMKENL